MSLFYILPPREHLEHALVELFARLLPDIPTGASSLVDRIPDLIAAAHPNPAELYFIHREDLPGLGELPVDLTRCYGAEPGDLVVEIGVPSGSAPARIRRWAIAPISNGRLAD